MKHEMNEGRPKSWDKTKRVYEILYPNGKRKYGKILQLVSVSPNMKIWTHMAMNLN